MAFRVPTPNVSVVDLTVRLEKPVSDAANVLMRSDRDTGAIEDFPPRLCFLGCRPSMRTSRRW